VVKMAEREIVVDKMRLTYEGLFEATELYRHIDEWCRSRGYDKCENKNIEKITPEGKYIEIEIEPWKKLTDYARAIIKLRIIMTDVKEVEVEKDGIKVRQNQGKIQLVFDGYLQTDYENRWEGSPLFYFLRTIWDKYIYKLYTETLKKNVLDDVNHLSSTIKSFLNLYRYTTTPWTAPGIQQHKP
jgi:hypothetical protein